MSAKYYSGVLCVFKNEGHILREWICHYLHRKIDKIYLLNDFSIDNFELNIKDLLEAYPERITLKNISDDDANQKWMGRQIFLYNKYYNDILKEVYWLGVFDADEFIWSPASINLNNILCQFENWSELLVSWYTFGSNGLITQPNEVVNNFIRRGECLFGKNNFPEYSDEIYCCKSWAKAKDILEIQHHFNRFNDGFCTRDLYNKEKKIDPNKSIYLSNGNQMQLNHYMCQSQNYYLNRKSQTRSINNFTSIENGKKSGELFFKIDAVSNQIEDLGLINQNENITL